MYSGACLLSDEVCVLCKQGWADPPPGLGLDPVTSDPSCPERDSRELSHCRRRGPETAARRQQKSIPVSKETVTRRQEAGSAAQQILHEVMTQPEMNQ